jgi:glycosyltransferase involved in cell wall biosynthesis
VRIGIDARKLHDFGIGTYIRNLLRQLAKLDRQTEFVVLCRPDDREALSSLGTNFRAVPETAGNYSISEQIRIPLALRREGVTLFHAPHYVLPPLVRCRSVVTIHDCIHLMFPQYLPNRLALGYARTSIAMAARRATRVLTVSESSKRDILRFVDIDPGKIDVIYNAYDERFGIEPREEDVVRVRERYQLHDEFVLYAGNVKPHKNLERLIQAFDLVRRRGLDRLKLVLIGDEISKYAALRRAVHQHQLHKYVRFLGYLPEETLAVMYRLAGVFVFPSLYEGFGLPPLEAMASGTPVVTSNVSSLPEVAGDAAMLVDPYDPAAIAEAIYQVLNDERLRKDLRHRGLARAHQFSWEQSVRRVRKIYGEVCLTAEPALAGVEAGVPRSASDHASTRARTREACEASTSDSLEPLRGAAAPSNSGGGGVPAALRESRAPREGK